MLANQIESGIVKKGPLGSELFSTVKTVFLNFSTATSMTGTGSFLSQTTAYVNIGHPVKEIIVKHIIFSQQASASPGNYDFAILNGDIVGGGTLGFAVTNCGTSSNPIAPVEQNVRHVYKTPTNISGTYSFNLVDFSGGDFASSSNASGYTNVRVAVILEFVAATSPVFGGGIVTDVST